MVPYSLYNDSIWYLKWTSKGGGLGTYLGPCSTVRVEGVDGRMRPDQWPKAVELNGPYHGPEVT